LGNSYLTKGLEGGDTANFRCAELSYREALGDLRPGDNSELMLAVFNNLGATAYVRSILEMKRTHLRRARRLWRVAWKKGGQAKGRKYTSAQVAWLNLQQLKRSRVKRLADKQQHIQKKKIGRKRLLRVNSKKKGKRANSGKKKRARQGQVVVNE
jgi:hypothetical protein